MFTSCKLISGLIYQQHSFHSPQMNLLPKACGIIRWSYHKLKEQQNISLISVVCSTYSCIVNTWGVTVSCLCQKQTWPEYRPFMDTSSDAFQFFLEYEYKYSSRTEYSGMISNIFSECSGGAFYNLQRKLVLMVFFTFMAKRLYEWLQLLSKTWLRMFGLVFQ